MRDVNLHITLPRRFNVFPTLSSPWKWLSQRFVTLLEASHCTCWSAHPLLAVISWSVKTTSCLSSWPQQLTQARHRAATTQMNDEGNQKTMDFEERAVTVSPSPATERNPQDTAVQESPVTRVPGAWARWRFVPTPVKIPQNRNSLWWHYPKSP